jgi:hypothetical protein
MFEVRSQIAFTDAKGAPSDKRQRISSAATFDKPADAWAAAAALHKAGQAVFTATRAAGALNVHHTTRLVSIGEDGKLTVLATVACDWNGTDEAGQDAVAKVYVDAMSPYLKKS